MRASTLFAMTAAILLGLGVAVWAKMSGYFSRSVDTPVAKRPEPQVLVAARNLFAGDTIESAAVRVRPMTESEIKYFHDHQQQLLPPLPAAAQLRVTAKNIETDTPITRDLLKDFAKPTALNERLLPDMRAMNLTLSKDRSAGGLIQVGEWVEVYLTSNIESENTKTTRTAVIAPKARVIAKRDTLWPVFAPLPKDKPVEYTIEVNPYRAALIEYSRPKGILSMSPLPHADQKQLEANRAERLAANRPGDNIALTALNDEEREEISLVQSVERSELIISEAELAKLFNLDLHGPTKEPPPATWSVERLIGAKRAATATFTLDGKPYSPEQSGTGNRAGPRAGLTLGAGSSYRFSQPDCPTCKKKQNQ